MKITYRENNFISRGPVQNIEQRFNQRLTFCCTFFFLMNDLICIQRHYLNCENVRVYRIENYTQLLKTRTVLMNWNKDLAI
jgi:hypothetical protein